MLAAWNAEASIARAVKSALAEPEVCEVLVVDDASSDATALVARQACDGSGRLKVLQQKTNLGPAAARNRAIAESEAPFIAMLDSDDFFVPGRFAALMSSGAWDAAVDNIAFVRADALADFDIAQLQSFSGTRQPLDLTAFVAGNMVRSDRPRAELGFIKPVLSRAFLQAHRIAYDETLRLGEDYILYARMLAAGAKFWVTDRVGYVAVERAESLSGRHSADDLAALYAADRALLADARLSNVERAAIERHAGQLEAKVHYRRLLDRRRQHGFAASLVTAVTNPRLLPRAIAAYARDKRNSSDPGNAQWAPAVRYLFGV